MRIVNIMLAKGLGGIEQSFLDYTHAMLAAGHEVDVVMHPKAKLLKNINITADSIHLLPNWGEWDVLAVCRLRRLLATLAPHVVVAHGNRALQLAAKAKAQPLVTVLHNYKIRIGLAQMVIAPTRDLVRFAGEQGVARERIHLVPNMVRVGVETPRRAWREPPVIGIMGRMVAKKGFDLFISALALLHERNVAFRAVIAGDGEEAAALKAQAQQLGLSEQVVFTGWVQDKSKFFSAIDVFCLPSHHEPFGIVLLEAMAEGLPVVATASEGPSEIIESGINGLLTPLGDAAALATALEEMLHDPRRAGFMARNGYDTVCTKYDMGVVREKLDLALRAAITL